MTVPTDRRDSDLLCFTTFRWHAVPLALRASMSRAASMRRVFVVEHATVTQGAPGLDVSEPITGLKVARPRVCAGMPPVEVASVQRSLLDTWLVTEGVEPGILWYQSPAAIEFSGHLTAALTVYDCVDRAAAAAARPHDFGQLEYALLERADVVFTDCAASRHALRLLHPNVRQVHAWCSRNAMDELLREVSRPPARRVALAASA